MNHTYQIAICDDEPKILNDLSKRIKEVFSQQKIEVEYVCMADSAQMMEHLQTNTIDVIFLDIDMPVFSGMDIAGVLNEKYPNAILVFVTSHDALVYQSFAYRPFAFIRKTHLDEELQDVIKRIGKELQARKRDLVISKGQELVRILIQDILYIEAEGNYLHIHTKNEVVRVRETMTNMEKELSQMQRECEKQKALAEEVQRMQEQIRALKHDMKNHTLVMLSYLEEEKKEEAKQYAGEILDKLNKMYTYVNVGNSLLNYILNKKLSKAKEQGCEIKAEIENLAFSYMDSVDFSAMLNNLLDNAIEGALKSTEKKVEVSISSKKGFDVISIRNSINDSVLEANPNLSSTKNESGHGFGMKQIQSVVEKYNGNMDIYEKEHRFIVNILLGEHCLSQ